MAYPFSSPQIAREYLILGLPAASQFATILDGIPHMLAPPCLFLTKWNQQPSPAKKGLIPSKSKSYLPGP